MDDKNNKRYWLNATETSAWRSLAKHIAALPCLPPRPPSVSSFLFHSPNLSHTKPFCSCPHSPPARPPARLALFVWPPLLIHPSSCSWLLAVSLFDWFLLLLLLFLLLILSNHRDNLSVATAHLLFAICLQASIRRASLSVSQSEVLPDWQYASCCPLAPPTE